MNSSNYRSWLASFADLVVRRRVPVLILLVLLVAIAGGGASMLKTQTTYRVWSPPGSPEIVDYDRMTELFGSNDSALVAFKDPKGLLRNEALKRIAYHTEIFAQIGGVKRIDSLSNFGLIKTSRKEHESGAAAVGPGLLFYAGEQNDIIRVELATGARTSISGPEGLVEHLALSGDQLIAAGLDRIVRVFDAKTGEQKHQLQGAPERISALALSPDGARVYAGSQRTVLGWDLKTGARLFRSEAHEGFVTVIAVSQDGAQIYAGAERLLALDATGKTSATLATAQGHLTDIALNKNALYLTSEDGALRRVDLKTQKSEVLIPASKVPALAVAVHGDKVYAGFENGEVRTVGKAQKTHKVAVVDLLALADGSLWSSAVDGSVSVMRPGQAPQALGGHRTYARRLIARANGEAVFSLGDDGAVYERRASDGAILDRFDRKPSQSVEITATSEGEPIGQISFKNLLSHPVLVQISGRDFGKVDPGAEKTLSKIPVSPSKACDSGDDCAKGQECDYTKLEPLCVDVVRVSARLPASGKEIWSKRTLLEGARLTSVRIPEEDAFGVHKVALPPLPEETHLGALLERFPAAKPVAQKQLSAEALQDAYTFVSPSRAGAMLEALPKSAPAELRELLGPVSERELHPNRLPLTPERIRDARRVMFRPPNPAAQGFVINEAADTTMLHLSLQELPHETALQRMVEIHDAVEAHLQEAKKKDGYNYQLSGEVIMDTNLKKYTERDQQRLGPVFGLLLIVVLALMFRRVSGVLLPMSAVGLAVAFTMGIVGYVGGVINNLTGVVPQVVLAICLGDSVHMFERFVTNLRSGMSAKEASKESVRFNFTPCLMATVTTFFGMMSLLPNRLPPIQDFGWMVGIGVAAAFIFSVTLLPALMSFVPVKAKAHAQENAEPGLGERLLVSMGQRVVSNPWKTVMFSTLGVASLCFGLNFAEFDTNPIKQFKPGTPFRDASEFIEDNITGPIGIEVVVDSGQPQGLRTRKYLEQVAKVQAHLQKDSEITKVVSLADIHRGIRRAFNGDLDSEYKLPQDDARTGAYYDAYAFSLPAGLELNNRVSDDQRATRISARVKNHSSGWAIDWQNNLLDWMKKNTPELKPTITGKFMIFSHVNISMTRSFFVSVSLAIAMITIAMTLALRSLRLGLISMIPNAIPGAMAIGVLGYMGRSLDMSIVVSLCVALGVVVDDTIHFLLKYKKYRDQMPPSEALIETYKSTGVALLITTIVLCIAFAIFMWTDYAITSNFGMTTCMVLAFGLLLDFTMTPALCLLSDPDRLVAERGRG